MPFFLQHQASLAQIVRRSRPLLLELVIDLYQHSGNIAEHIGAALQDKMLNPVHIHLDVIGLGDPQKDARIGHR